MCNIATAACRVVAVSGGPRDGAGNAKGGALRVGTAWRVFAADSTACAFADVDGLQVAPHVVPTRRPQGARGLHPLHPCPGGGSWVVPVLERGLLGLLIVVVQLPYTLLDVGDVSFLSPIMFVQRFLSCDSILCLGSILSHTYICIYIYIYMFCLSRVVCVCTCYFFVFFF